MDGNRRGCLPCLNNREAVLKVLALSYQIICDVKVLFFRAAQDGDLVHRFELQQAVSKIKEGKGGRAVSTVCQRGRPGICRTARRGLLQFRSEERRVNLALIKTTGFRQRREIVVIFL